MAKKKAEQQEQQEPTFLAIKQVRSLSGRPDKHRRTMEALGFRKHQQTIVQVDNPAIRGMLFQVRHLVEVEVIGQEEA